MEKWVGKCFLSPKEKLQACSSEKTSRKQIQSHGHKSGETKVGLGKVAELCGGH